MKNIKASKIAQLTGIALILIGSSSIFIENTTNNHNALQVILAIGFVFITIATFLQGRLKNSIVALLVLLISSNMVAQDYTKQVEAFAQSFADKNTTVLQKHISTKLHFKPIPITSTATILTKIVANFPKLNSLSIVESEPGKAKVAYDFEKLGVSKSFIHFDSIGKIVRIQFIENIINQEIEAQRQQKVPLPTPGALSEKYIPKKTEFKAPDGLIISGYLYEVDKNKPIILLMHQAGYNYYEYSGIAPKLNDLGYNCLAIDLRSGGDFAGKSNITNERAIKKGLKPEMIDAQQDVEAAIDYLHRKYQQNVIVWGSSFSSSLALLVGANHPKVKTIVSFSPGDYFGDAAPSLANIFEKIEKPYWVTSSKAEAETLTSLIEKSNPKKNQYQFIPESNGFHGSRALWQGQEGAEEYWNAVKEFLLQNNN